MAEQKKLKVSFREKNPTKCPVCGQEFYKETMLSGGGRLIAGKLTDELRRLYEKSNKYGYVHPLIYEVTVCPRCLYAAYPRDFNSLSEKEIADLRSSAKNRLTATRKFFGKISFTQDRNLGTGAASYILAVECYGIRDKSIAPTFKRAMSAIRASWLLGDIYKFCQKDLYQKLSLFFANKAYVFYAQCLELIQSGEEALEKAGNIGPDYGKNWGYEGILYMNAILTVKYGSQEKDLEKRIENYEKTKRFLSRLFGSGKSSKTRPSQLIDMTRDLYNQINEQIEQWQKEEHPVG